MEPVTPAYRDIVLVNPLCGFAPRAQDLPNDDGYSMAFEYLTWRDIEPQQGVIDTTRIERLLQLPQLRARGLTAAIRIVLDYPGTRFHTDLPDWVYEAIGGDGVRYDTDYGKGFSPNYANETLIALHRDMLERFAAIYGDEDAIGLIELGSVGHWGEWHVHTDVNNQLRFPKASVYNQYIQPYIDCFPGKYLSIRRPMDVPEANGFGLFHDAIGDRQQTYDWFLKWAASGYVWWQNKESLPAMPDYWRNAPTGGEPVVSWQTLLSDKSFEGILQQVRDLRLSYWKTTRMGFPDNETLQARFETLQKTMGYRFTITGVTAETGNGQAYLRITLANRGAAAFVPDWPYEITLLDSGNRVMAAASVAEKPRALLPGKTQELLFPWGPMENLPYGTYRVCLAIDNPETGSPAIAFPHDAVSGQKRYPIAILRHDPPAAE